MIRLAQTTDADAITALLIRSIRELCGPDYENDEEILSLWCRNKTPENIRAWVDNPNNYFIVAENADVVAGTALLSNAGEVVVCYLLPEYIGRGFGKAMLDDLINRARALGLSKITLESTRTARSFYRHQGFQELGETECQGSIPGFLMEYALT